MSEEEFPGLTRCVGTKCTVAHMCVRYTAQRYPDSTIMHPPKPLYTKGDPAIPAEPCEFLTLLEDNENFL